MTPKLYKFMREGLKSSSGVNKNWKIGIWRKEKSINICKSGFHASKTPLQALGYVSGEIVAQVSVRGESIKEKDKECWSGMRIDKAWNWTKRDSVELAVFSAELVIDIYEKEYHKDDRPRKAIEAAKEWLKNPSAAAASSAAASASASDSAAYAYAAYAYAAYAASAYAATSYSAYAATSYSASAAYAYAAAAKKELVSKIDKWFAKKLKTLTPWKHLK